MTDKKKSSVNRRILQIAIPSIISNITVPLLGLIDVTIVGHLGSPAYIGAIAVGGMLFNIIYWIFGFLRMGTSGMTSQAYGQHDLNEITRLLLRSVGVGLFIALCLLILQYHPETGIYTDTNHTGGQATGNNLFLHLHLGSPSHIRALWIRRLVYRDAEFTFSHVYRYYSKYCQHCSQSMFCLLIGHENGRSGNRNFNCPICRFLHGYFVIHALL